MKLRKHFICLVAYAILFNFSQNISAQVVGPYTGIDYATDYTNPIEGPACGSIAGVNAAIGDADFANGAADIPIGWHFSGTWSSGSAYFDGIGDELLLVSLHTYDESWNVALRLSDGTTTTYRLYDLTLVTSNALGSLATCGGVVLGFNYERPSQLVDFADYIIPPGEGVIGVVFEPISDGAGPPDPHGVLVLEGTRIIPPCADLETSVSATEICEGESVVLSASSTLGGTVSWDGGVVSGIAFEPPMGSTTYTATSDVEEDCDFTVTIIVNELPIVTATTDNREICLGQSFTLTGGGATTYEWDNSIEDGEVNTPIAAGSTIYTVIGTDDNGCESMASITVNVLDCPKNVPGFIYDPIVCIGDCVELQDTSTGPTISTWEWEFNDAVDPTTSAERSPLICFDTLGVFDITLTITSTFGVEEMVTRSVTVYPLPTLNTELDTIIDLGGTADLIATSMIDGEYTWSPEYNITCSDCPITTAKPSESTTYKVDFIDVNGCPASDTVLVLVNFIEGIGVPTAFSPNGDYENDVLFVKGEGLASMYFAIYNRYGELIFETSDQNIGWDGTYLNRPQNPGVFTWILQYEFLTGKRGKQKGNTTLFR